MFSRLFRLRVAPSGQGTSPAADCRSTHQGPAGSRVHCVVQGWETEGTVHDPGSTARDRVRREASEGDKTEKLLSLDNA